MLGDSARAFSPDPGGAEDLALVESGGEQDWQAGDDLEVILAHACVGLRPRQPESRIDAFEQVEGDSQLVADFGVRAAGARRRIGELVQVGSVSAPSERAVAIRAGAMSNASSSSTNWTRSTSRYETVPPRALSDDSESTRLSDALRSRAGALRDLCFGQPRRHAHRCRRFASYEYSSWRRHHS